ncbi:MAG: DUF3014 domain-containing protein [Pseudomonadota bacterium]|nr:DUF3014 domain-containing protein [Pseudomonadota bacterium]
MGRYDRNKGKRTGRYNPAKDKSSDGIHVVVVLVLIILAGASGFFAKQLMDDLKDQGKSEVRALAIPFNTGNTDAAESTRTNITDTEQAQTGVSEAADDNIETLQAVEELVVLPELDSSDAPIRESITQVAPELAPWLNTGQLIRTYMVIANDFSQGLRSGKHMYFLKLDQPLSADQNDTGLVIAAKSYQRYDKLAQAIEAIDAPAILAVYKKFRPLLLQVYSEFSYPAGYSLEDMFTKAAAEVLAAPVIDEPIALVRTSTHYKFADPQLEALNPVHKQMIRMGPENTRLIQSKVRLLVEEMANLKD